MENENVVIERRHIERAKELLKTRAMFAGTDLFEHLCFEDSDWFYSKFSEADHHPYVDACLAFAQCEMHGVGGLFHPIDPQE